MSSPVPEIGNEKALTVQGSGNSGLLLKEDPVSKEEFKDVTCDYFKL